MSVPPADPGILAPWMSRQRWFSNKAAVPVVHEVGRFELDSSEPGVEIAVHLLLDDAGHAPALYQVPLTYRSRQVAELEGAMVGELGSRFVYDGPHDAAFTTALLALIADQREARGDGVWAMGRRTTDVIGAPIASRVLIGEQSNTSIIYELGDAAPPVICKLFRALHHGENPDVELQTALALAGSEAVPSSFGNVIADWSDRRQPGGRARGHLAFAQEFLAGASDAWRVALASAAAGEDFSDAAREIGIATAGAHATLAVALPSEPTRPSDIASAIEQMHGRLATAIAEVPGLAVHAPAIRGILDSAAQTSWPPRQRIHGDLHLGQVLAVPGRGFMLVDFEGEPLRPMHERGALDAPLRDVAGMLRSFDYVGGSLAMEGREAPVQWAPNARAAFLDGYARASGDELAQHSALLNALELDKALYETVYEARNRPAWVGIPVNAIERLAARSLM